MALQEVQSDHSLISLSLIERKPCTSPLLLEVMPRQCLGTLKSMLTSCKIAKSVQNHPVRSVWEAQAEIRTVDIHLELSRDMLRNLSRG